MQNALKRAISIRFQKDICYLLPEEIQDLIQIIGPINIWRESIGIYEANIDDILISITNETSMANQDMIRDALNRIPIHQYNHLVKAIEQKRQPGLSNKIEYLNILLMRHFHELIEIDDIIKIIKQLHEITHLELEEFHLQEFAQLNYDILLFAAFPTLIVSMNIQKQRILQIMDHSYLSLSSFIELSKQLLKAKIDITLDDLKPVFDKHFRAFHKIWSRVRVEIEKD